MARTRRNAWPGARAAHRIAARIGWAFRPRRKKGPRSASAYLRAAGVSSAALARYVKGRKSGVKRLYAKRSKRGRRGYRIGRVRVNAGRRPGRYAMFVKRFAARSRLRGPALMRAAGRAWRGSRGNADPFPMVNARRRRRGRSRRNYALPGLVYYNRKRRRGRSRRNPVLPFVAWDNGRKGRRGRTVKYSRWWDDNRRRRRRARAGGNPVLPYGAFNPGSSDNPLEAVGEAFEVTFTPEFWKDTVLPLGAGFIGGQFVGGLVQALAEKVVGRPEGVLGSIQRIGSRALGAVGVSALAFFATKNRNIAGKVLAGGLVAVLGQVLVELFGSETYAKVTGTAGFGGMAADLTEELKARIADSVRGEIARAEGVAPGGVSAFVTTQDVAASPVLGPGHRMGDMADFVSTQALQTAPVAAPAAEIPMVADLSSFSDSMMDMMLV